MQAAAFAMPQKGFDTRGIALADARLCTVCWTVHKADDCPECSARQWLYLAPLLRGFMGSTELPAYPSGRPMPRS